MSQRRNVLIILINLKRFEFSSETSLTKTHSFLTFTQRKSLWPLEHLGKSEQNPPRTSDIANSEQVKDPRAFCSFYVDGLLRTEQR